MEAEWAALAASGATTLVGLVISDSWSHVRDRLGEFFARHRDGGLEEALTELDGSRRELVTAHEDGDGLTAARTAADVTAAWLSRLHRLARTDPVAAEEFLRLLDSLNGRPQEPPTTVHNVISGGTQRGPVIQSGRITGLAFPSPDIPPPHEERYTADGQ
ncbi:hypothetical protein [Streptomyces macrosporus]|uniref:Uncharacterized protein n=1 Tax=Streptomyces macrosporus TaxID=44032 RepID=A0ABN3KAT0_9ACTN